MGVSEASKVKLKLRVEAPVIRMPKSSSDMDSVELDLGLLELENEFVAPRTSSGGACVIEETQISLSQIQAVATLMGQQHAGMVHQSQPIMLTLRRPTVGQWGARAGMECHVSIPILRAEGSEEEYSFMVTVAQQNLSEAAKTPGCAFRTGSVESSARPRASSRLSEAGLGMESFTCADEGVGGAEDSTLPVWNAQPGVFAASDKFCCATVTMKLYSSSETSARKIGMLTWHSIPALAPHWPTVGR